MVNTDYAPSHRLLEALTEFLLGGDWATPEDAALAALIWMHERPDLGDPEDRHFAPLTDAQIVARIRHLVGGSNVDEGEHEALKVERSDLAAEVARLEAENLALSGDLFAARAEVTRLQADIDAWMSLAPRYSKGDAQG